MERNLRQPVGEARHDRGGYPPDEGAGAGHRLADERADAEVAIALREDRGVGVARAVHQHGGGAAPAVARVALDRARPGREGEIGPAREHRQQLIVQVAAAVEAHVDHQPLGAAEAPEDLREGAAVGSGVHRPDVDVAEAAAGARRHRVPAPAPPALEGEVALPLQAHRHPALAKRGPVRLGECHLDPPVPGAAQEAAQAAVVGHGLAVDRRDHVAGGEPGVAGVERAGGQDRGDAHAGAGKGLVVVEAEGGGLLARRHARGDEGPGMRGIEFARHLGQELGEVAGVGQRRQEAGVAGPHRIPVDPVHAGIEELRPRQAPILIEARREARRRVVARIGLDPDVVRGALGEVDLGEAGPGEDHENLLVAAQPHRRESLVGQVREDRAPGTPAQVADGAGQGVTLALRPLGALDDEQARPVAQHRGENHVDMALRQPVLPVLEAVRVEGLGWGGRPRGGPLRRPPGLGASGLSGVGLRSPGRVDRAGCLGLDRHAQARLVGVPGPARGEDRVDVGRLGGAGGGVEVLRLAAPDQHAAVRAPARLALALARRRHPLGRSRAVRRHHRDVVGEAPVELDRQRQPVPVRRPGQPPRRVAIGVEPARRHHLAVGTGRGIEDVDRAAVVDVGEPPSVRRPGRQEGVARRGRQRPLDQAGRLSKAPLVGIGRHRLVEAPPPVALGRVGEAPAVGREGGVALLARRAGDPLDRLAVAGGDVDLALRHQGDLVTRRRQGQVGEVGGAGRHLVGECRLRRRDRHGLGALAPRPQAIDPPVAGEGEVAGAGGGEEAHRRAVEARDLARHPVGQGQAPDVERAGRLAQIGDLAARQPDRAAALARTDGQPLVAAGGRIVEPDLAHRLRDLVLAEALLDIGAGVEEAPPLRIPGCVEGSVGQDERLAPARERHGVDLVREFGAERGREGAGGIAEARGGEQHRAPVGRHAHRPLVEGVPGQAPGLAAGRRNTVEVEGAGPIGGEGEAPPIGRPHRRLRVGAGLGQGPGLAARRRNGPDPTAIPERDAACVRRQGRLAQPERRWLLPGLLPRSLPADLPADLRRRAQEEERGDEEPAHGGPSGERRRGAPA